MNIHGIQFDCEVSDILNELRVQLSANGIQLFSKVFDSGDDVMCQCPYHKNGQERKPSAGIRKSDGKFHCLSCGVTTDIDEMVANCFGYSDPAWGYKWIVRNFATVKVEERKEIELDISRNRSSGVRDTVLLRDFASDEELDSYRYTHPYLYERGLTDEIIEYFDIGYDKHTDSITFPVREWLLGAYWSKTKFVARRSVKTKRFDLPKDMEKPLYGLFEYYKAMEIDIPKATHSKYSHYEPVYVCEGLFDCLRLWCNGKYAVAGFGCLFSEYQLKLLEELPTRKLILALDNDKAGRDGANRIRQAIKNKIITEVILPDGKKDVGECSDEEIQNLSEVF